METTKPSEVLEQFLGYMDTVKNEYEEAYSIVGEEDRRLQDLLHALEFAANSQEKNKIATRLQQSRKRRRKAKDRVKELEKIYELQNEQASHTFLKKMKSTLSQQKGNEQYLTSKREYKKRVKDD
uniref:hypothetical protein n=1 Tax=Acetatifactor sp. TaxID=1872090 RepID=UPI0040572D24